MSDSIRSSEAHPDHLHGVVEAFLDGEVVDPSALRTALADSTARDHFIELLMIRRATRVADCFAANLPAASTGKPRVARWLAAVAAAALASVSLGYAAGQRVVASNLAAASVEATVIVDAAPAAPPATKTITLRPGVNWTDGPGGQ
jgi:hypothetical protein